jgi:polyhydroxyalkanoate synthesis regulator phasin
LGRLYEDILGIARNYMGAAAEDYVRRRIRIVLGGRDPEDMTLERIDRLAAGIDMTAKGYMSPQKAKAFRDEVLALKNGRY